MSKKKRKTAAGKISNSLSGAGGIRYLQTRKCKMTETVLLALSTPAISHLPAVSFEEKSGAHLVIFRKQLLLHW